MPDTSKSTCATKITILFPDRSGCTARLVVTSYGALVVREVKNMDPETKKYLDRIYLHVKRIEEQLNAQKEKSTFVTANQLNKMFGLTCRDLFRLRSLNQIEFRKTGKQRIRYRLESLPKELVSKIA